MVSADFRKFLAQLAIDPEAYGRYLADPLGFARKAGLSERQLKVLTSNDQNHWYAALTADADESGDSA
jgi:hypothetical protein